MNDQYYKQALYDLLSAVDDITKRRSKFSEIENRRTQIYDAMERLIVDALSIPDKDNKWDIQYKPLQYSIHFRLPTGEKVQRRKYEDGIYVTTEEDGKIGFFFVSGSYPRWRVKDYNNTYSNESGTWSHNSLLLIIDYAEDIIEKARNRMKQKKYRDQYDLSALVDVLHSLCVLRGDTYVIRKGTPPAKQDALRPVDPVTGKLRKQRSSDKINIPFKITSVEVGT